MSGSTADRSRGKPARQVTADEWCFTEPGAEERNPALPGYAAALEAPLQQAIDGEVRFGPGDRALCAYYASIFRQVTKVAVAVSATRSRCGPRRQLRRSRSWSTPGHGPVGLGCIGGDRVGGDIQWLDRDPMARSGTHSPS